MPQPPATGLKLSAGERKELLRLRRHRNMPQSVILRVNIVLEAASGTANKVIARQLSTSLPTVLLWRRRYEAKRLEGILQDQPRSGRPRRISDETIASIVDATMKTKPKDATHWSVRSMAKNQPVSAATVYRIWQKHKLQPHRVESF